MFFELFMAVLLANVALQVITFFAAKFYFGYIMNQWLNSEETDNA